MVGVGLLACWREMGLTIVPFKKGPDYIDAAWLGLAAGLDCHHLDPYLMTRERILGSYLKCVQRGHGAVIEGNRGLYDGVDAHGTFSTAELAKCLRLPVVVVLDATKTTRTAAAMVLGLRQLDPEVDIQGVVLNQVGSARHESILMRSIEQYGGVGVLGAVPRLKALDFPERHLGLVPPQEHGLRLDVVQRAAEAVRRYVNTEALWGIAQKVGELPPLSLYKGRSSQDPEERFRVGVLRDEAFHFYYPENLEALEERGGELVPFSALESRGLPQVDALYIGGGFPEMRARELAENESLRKEIRHAVEEGLPVYAECGGLMYLGNGLKMEGREFPMVGALPLTTEILERPQGHGYTALETVEKNPFYPVGLSLKGHEFHYSRIISLQESEVSFAFRVRRGSGMEGKREGIVRKNALATYTHLHALGCDAWADGIACRARSQRHFVRPRLVMEGGLG